MDTDNKMKVVIITGLSGAGKTHAADWFEDQGYYCVDNMPPSLIKNFLDLTSYMDNRVKKAAFVVDIRSDEFFADLNETLDFLRKAESIEFSILFIEASDSVLIKRYNETRRNHPLTEGITTKEVIEQEREMLDDLRRRADYVIDTSSMKVPEFSYEMDKLFAGTEVSENKFAINVVSFGYKYGIPQEMDIVFDMRFIPNPFYIPSLKKLTGNNKKVSQYVLKQDITKEFIKQMDKMINTIAPHYKQEGKYHLNIAFGCTGGQHRSVAMANEMGRIFKEEGYRVTIEHREV